METTALVLLIMTLVILFCDNNQNIWLNKIHEDLQELIKLLKDE